MEHAKFDFDVFDAKAADALAENERVMAWRIEDHKLALEGTANAIAELRHQQNGDDA